jgi:hypothetical protein
MSSSNSRTSTFAPVTSNMPAIKPMSFATVQRKCSCGAQTAGGGTCDSCARKQGKIQRKPNGSTASETVPGIVYDVLRSPGTTLDHDTRRFFESRFNHDFSDVRVHTDAAAARSASELGANAFTVGRHIAFGGSQYDPRGQAGKQLLAHELTHVVQQSGSSPGVLSNLAVESESSAAEHEADARAAQVLSSASAAPVNVMSGAALQLDRTEEQKPAAAEASSGGVASASLAVTLSGIYFEIPPGAKYTAGRKAPQIFAVMLSRLLGPAYQPYLLLEAEGALKRANRQGAFRDQTPAKAGEEAAAENHAGAGKAAAPVRRELCFVG